MSTDVTDMDVLCYVDIEWYMTRNGIVGFYSIYIHISEGHLY